MAATKEANEHTMRVTTGTALAYHECPNYSILRPLRQSVPYKGIHLALLSPSSNHAPPCVAGCLVHCVEFSRTSK